MSPAPRVLVYQHSPLDGPGYLAEALERRGASLHTAHLYRGDPPPDPAGYDLLLVMGGAMNVYQEDRHPWLLVETECLRAAVAGDVPVLGVCLGGQLLAKALDVPVHLGGAPEIDLAPIALTEAGRADPLFAGLPALEAVVWHDDTFAIPDGAAWLARSPGCAHQAFRVGRCAYGLQFHPEVSPVMLADWIRVAPAGLGGRLAALQSRVDARAEALRAQADCLVENFLQAIA